MCQVFKALTCEILTIVADKNKARIYYKVKVLKCHILKKQENMVCKTVVDQLSCIHNSKSLKYC